MNWLKRPDVHYPLIIAAVAAALWAPRLRGTIDLRFDAGVYYILGTSIAEGKGYRLLSEPGEISVLQYPPLLPAIVAAEQKLLGSSDPAVVGPWLRWTYLALFFAFALGVYRLSRDVLTPGYSFLVALICTLSGDMLYLSDLLQAELPFAAVTMWFAIVARSLHRDKEQPIGAARFAVSAVLAAAGFLIRSAGVALLGAWVGEAVLRRQWKQVALRCVVAAVPFLAWQAWVSHVRHSPEYATPTYAYQRASYQYYNVSYVENVTLVDSFKPELGTASPWKITKRVVKNSFTMPDCVGDAVSSMQTMGTWTVNIVYDKLNVYRKPQVVPWPVRCAGIAYGVASFAGLVLLLFRRSWFVPLYVGATMFLMCLTPWPEQFRRYIVPATPLLVIAMTLTAARAREWLAARPSPQRRGLRVVGTGAIALALGIIPVLEAFGDSFAFDRRHRPLTPGGNKLLYVDNDWLNWQQAATWVGEHSRPDDVIATCSPQLVYLQSGRKSVFPPMENRPDLAQQYVDSVPVRFVIVGTFKFLQIDKRYAEPMVLTNPTKWKLVFSVGEGDKATRVYERVP